MIEYLAISLVKRANQVLEREKTRLDSISEQLPSTVGERLRRSIRQTSEEVALLSKDIKRKQKEVKRTLRQASQTEFHLK
jgi:gas vesicle protein